MFRLEWKIHLGPKVHIEVGHHQMSSDRSEVKPEPNKPLVFVLDNKADDETLRHRKFKIDVQFPMCLEVLTSFTNNFGSNSLYANQGKPRRRKRRKERILPRSILLEATWTSTPSSRVTNLPLVSAAGYMSQRFVYSLFIPSSTRSISGSIRLKAWAIVCRRWCEGDHSCEANRLLEWPSGSWWSHHPTFLEDERGLFWKSREVAHHVIQGFYKSDQNCVN